MNLTPRDLSRIAEIHDLRRRAGMPPMPDERIARAALTDGLTMHRDELRHAVEMFEKPEPNLVRLQAC